MPGYDVICLQSQYLGGRGRSIRSLRSSLTTQKFKASQGSIIPNQAGKMAQRVKVPAINLDDLSLIPEPYLVEAENGLLQVVL